MLTLFLIEAVLLVRVSRRNRDSAWRSEASTRWRAGRPTVLQSTTASWRWFLFSAAVGVVFGFFPARRAAGPIPSMLSAMNSVSRIALCSVPLYRPGLTGIGLRPPAGCTKHRSPRCLPPRGRSSPPLPRATANSWPIGGSTFADAELSNLIGRAVNSWPLGRVYGGVAPCARRAPQYAFGSKWIAADGRRV